jgi:hypothetical protein
VPKVFLVGLAFDQAEELDILEFIEFGSVYELNMLESQRDLLLLSHPLSLFLQ